MSGREVVRVGSEDAGRRLDRVIADRVPRLSRTLARHLIDEGHVELNGKPVKSDYRVRSGDMMSVELTLPPSLTAKPEAVALTIVYEDEAMAVIDKPAGLVVHPAPGHESGTLVNALVARYPTLVTDGDDPDPAVMPAASGLPPRPGIVHRLDKDTSGLMVVALNEGSQRALADQIRTRRMRRRYLALVAGNLEPDRATIDVAVGRDPAGRKRMAAGSRAVAARNARTHYRVLERVAGFTLIEATLDTGRTHQIRVHLAYISHPLAGDVLYGGPTVDGLQRQFLHACALELDSPLTGARLSFESPLPPDLDATLSALRGR